jgi:hypothetical protein
VVHERLASFQQQGDFETPSPNQGGELGGVLYGGLHLLESIERARSFALIAGNFFQPSIYEVLLGLFFLVLRHIKSLWPWDIAFLTFLYGVICNALRGPFRDTRGTAFASKAPSSCPWGQRSKRGSRKGTEYTNAARIPQRKGAF